jgi:hypothetical protein
MFYGFAKKAEQAFGRNDRNPLADCNFDCGSNSSKAATILESERHKLESHLTL